MNEASTMLNRNTDEEKKEMKTKQTICKCKYTWQIMCHYGTARIGALKKVLFEKREKNQHQ